MLRDAHLIGFVGTADIDRAVSFYEETLGLTLLSRDPFACEFDANGTSIRVTPVPEVVVVPYTALGWRVRDIAATARELTNRGVTFERFPGMELDELGVWRSPGGAQVAWFKDPDGNLLSLTQQPDED